MNRRLSRRVESLRARGCHGLGLRTSHAWYFTGNLKNLIASRSCAVVRSARSGRVELDHDSGKGRRMGRWQASGRASQVSGLEFLEDCEKCSFVQSQPQTQQTTTAALEYQRYQTGHKAIFSLVTATLSHHELECPTSTLGGCEHKTTVLCSPSASSDPSPMTRPG